MQEYDKGRREVQPQLHKSTIKNIFQLLFTLLIFNNTDTYLGIYLRCLLTTIAFGYQFFSYLVHLALVHLLYWLPFTKAMCSIKSLIMC